MMIAAFASLAAVASIATPALPHPVPLLALLVWAQRQGYRLADPSPAAWRALAARYAEAHRPEAAQ